MTRLVPTGAFLLALIIVFVYVTPTYSGAIAQANAQIKLNQDALDAAKRFQDRVQKLRDDKAAISQKNLENIATLLPSSVDNVGLILDLNALASRTGMVLSNLNVTSAGTGGEDPSMTQMVVGHADLTLTATGTYGAFRAFLDGIEKSERLLDVQTLSVAGSETGVYSYNLTLRLYWLR